MHDIFRIFYVFLLRFVDFYIDRILHECINIQYICKKCFSREKSKEIVIFKIAVTLDKLRASNCMTINRALLYFEQLEVIE